MVTRRYQLIHVVSAYGSLEFLKTKQILIWILISIDTRFLLFADLKAESTKVILRAAYIIANIYSNEGSRFTYGVSRKFISFELIKNSKVL